MKHKYPRVKFRLFSFENVDAKQLLSPEGTIVLQYLGFPRDLEDCTCIPFGPVGMWARTGVTELDAQWYKSSDAITREDIPRSLVGSPRVKDYLCHQLRPDRNSYPISALYVDNEEVQMVAFVDKCLHFRRLGHAIELDLRQVPDDKRFTLAIEWSYHHIEARVTWLEGEGLDQYFSGRGVPYDQLVSYQPPQVGRVVQFKVHKEFETTLLPAEVAKAIWSQYKDTIVDTDASGNPVQEISAPRKAYRDDKDFAETIVGIFTEIQGILKKTKPHAFWNDKRPKTEPDSGMSLRLLFEAICAYKNIKVYQEDPSRSGDVDFVFSGISTDTDHLELVLEIKNAHSDRLERGLTKQLPQYIAERQSGNGVYGILWYKGRYFDKPDDMTINDCLSRLQDIKPKEVYDIVAFDLSFPVQASKL